MKYSEIKNIKWSNAQNTAIDCTLVTEIGELPFTANPVDVEAFGRDLYEFIFNTMFSQIQPFEEPEAEIPVLRQFSINKDLKVNTL